MRSFLKKGWLWLVILLLVPAIWLMFTYNKLVVQEESVSKYIAELQATYQRRLDLLPNLVSVVKANSEFEKTVLQQVTEARALAAQVSSSNITDAEGFKQMEGTQGQLAVAANRLLAVIENYPDLRATDAFVKLQTQIEGSERRIKIARNDFNGAVKSYNQEVRSFPTNVAAGLFGFKVKEGFTADAGAAQPPEIKF
jgi:LemA protein